MTSALEIPWYWQRVDLFDGTPVAARRSFLGDADRLEFRRGQPIFSADDVADRVFYLERGMVKIFHLSANGAVTVFWFCVPGDLFGAGGISGSSQQSVFGQAAEPALVYALPRAAFEQLVHCHPQLGINVIRLMGARLRLACDAVADNATRRTDERLARVLLRLAAQCGEPSGTEVRFGTLVTHQELANMVGACRQSVNRILKGFERSGWLRSEGRTLIVTDAPALASVFAGSAASARQVTA